MSKDDLIIVNREDRVANGMKDAVYSRVCNKLKCELIPINVETHGIDKNKLVITGLAITQKPRPGIFIPKETFEKYGHTLVGRPLADGHGSFPWSDIKVDEVLGVVKEQWYDDNFEAQMFKAEVWDEKAVQVLKSGMYNKFSVAYYYNFEYGKMTNEYDEEEDVVIVNEMDYDHVAFLNRPQVPEAEVKEIEELSRNKESYMDSEMFSGKNSEYLAKTYRHNSITKKDEPDWGGVDKTRLPWQAFGNMDSMDKQKKSTWKYPHHWIDLGKLYLHRGGLVYALAAAKGARSGKKASPEIFKHLNKHIKAIKLSSEEIKEELEKLEIEDQEIEEILNDLNQAFGGSDMTKEDVIDTTKEVVVETVVETAQEEKPVVETVAIPEQNSPVVKEQVVAETVIATVPETLAVDNDPSIEKVAQMSVELNKKDTEIAELKKTISKFEEEKTEQEIEKRISILLKEGKILPAKKDETVALYKATAPAQWEAFEKILEKNSAIPIGEESGGMDDERSDKNQEPKKTGFYT